MVRVFPSSTGGRLTTTPLAAEPAAASHLLPTFDPSSYPRCYRPRAVLRWLYLLLAAVALGGAVALVWLGAVAWQAGPGLAAWEGWTLGTLCLAAAAAWMTAAALRPRLVLHADHLMWRGVLRTRHLQFSQLKGWSRHRGLTGESALRLVPAAANLRPLDLPPGLATDLAHDLWMARLPDLDADALDRSLRHLVRNSGLPADECLRRLGTLNLLQQYAMAATAGLAALSVGPWPALADLAWAALLSMPCALLLLAGLGRRWLRMDRALDDVRLSLLGLFGTACVALWPRTMADNNLQQPLADGLWVAVGAAASALLLSAGLSRVPAWGRDRWYATLPFSALFLGALALWFNQHPAADPKPQVHQTALEAKHRVVRRWLRWELTLAPWQAGQPSLRVGVPARVFNLLGPGETVCLLLHPGRLSWAWWQAEPCAEPLVQIGRWPGPLGRALVLAAAPPGQQAPAAQQLRAGRLDELEARFSELQHRYESGGEPGTALLQAYRDFYDPNPDLDAPLDAWVARHPRSHAAWLARGIHRRFQVLALEAAGFVRQVSPEHNADATEQAQLSDLERAAQLARRPGLAYLHMADRLAERAEPATFDQWMQRALLADADNLALQGKLLILLGRRGQEAQRAHLRKVKEQRPPLSTATLQALEARMALQEGIALRAQGREAEAIQAFSRVVSQQAWYEDSAWALYEQSGIHSSAGRYAEAVALLERAVTINSHCAQCQALLGWALHRLQRTPEALPVLQRAANLGDPWAQGFLGRLMIEGRWLPRDVEAGTLWVNRGANAGDAEAQAALRQHPEWRHLR